MLFEAFLFADEFVTFSMKFLSLALVRGNFFIAIADAFHISLDHISQALRLLRAIFLKPSADNVKQSLHAS